VAKPIAVDGLKLKLSPAKLSSGDPVVLMPSMAATINGKGVMAGTITAIYSSINDPGFSPMPGTFNIRGSGSKVLVGGNPVVLKGDKATTTIVFPGGPNGSVDALAVTCEVVDAAQDDGSYLE
jgi:hypothetical protein